MPVLALGLGVPELIVILSILGLVTALMVAVVIGVLAIRRRSGNTGPRQKCPDCAELVAAEARVCKHCGYRFAAPPNA